MNADLEEGEIKDASAQLVAGSMAGFEFESWSQRWKTHSSKSSRLYFYNIESKQSIWVDEFGKVGSLLASGFAQGSVTV